MDAKTLLKLGGATKVFASAVMALLPPSATPEPAQPGLQQPGEVTASIAECALQLFSHESAPIELAAPQSHFMPPAQPPNCASTGAGQ